MRPPPPPAEPTLPASPRPLPTPEELASIDVRGFLDRLDGNLAAISFDSTFEGLLPGIASAAPDDPRFAAVEPLFRETLKSTLLATSFRDLSPEARLHPEVQSRMWGAMDDIDSAVRRMAATLESITPEERADITRALREHPELGERALAAIVAESDRAGVSPERREHLRSLGQHACFRLRHSADGFIEEHLDKLRRAKDRPVADAERHLAAQLGHDFDAERTWHLAVHEEWQKLLAAADLRLTSAGSDGPSGGIDADDAYAPPAGGQPPPPKLPYGFNPDRGKSVLRVGAWLFGISVMCGLTGGVLVQMNGDAAFVGLISFTFAAVFALAGMICLLVGGILRLLARRDQRLLYENGV
ncbi:MAG: hypothetical protein U0441_17130 [Polyangiaceae bacterium]